MNSIEEIKIDLFDNVREDNKRFANLVDGAKWQKLKESYDGGRGEKSFDELLTELLKSR